MAAFPRGMNCLRGLKVCGHFAFEKAFEKNDPRLRKAGFYKDWQPGCPQLQESSVVSFASSQYSLQYLLCSLAMQLQAG